MYKGNKEYKIDCNDKLWLFITNDCEFSPRYDRWATKYINKHRRQRDKRDIGKYIDK